MGTISICSYDFSFDFLTSNLHRQLWLSPYLPSPTHLFRENYLRSSSVSMLLGNTMNGLYSVCPSSIGITEHFLCPQLPLHLFSWFIFYSTLAAPFQSALSVPYAFISRLVFIWTVWESLHFSTYTVFWHGYNCLLLWLPKWMYWKCDPWNRGVRSWTFKNG